MGGLTQVVLATGAFVGTHLLMSHPLRALLVARLGERAFLGVYTLVSLATFAWMALAVRSVGPEVALWTAPGWAWSIASLVMLMASILFAGSLIGNPALPGMPAGAGEPRGVLAITRHPMMWSFALWAFVHAIAWPEPSQLVLCAGIALLALGGSVGQDAKKARLQPESWPAWQARTSFIPFAGPASLKAMWPGWGVVIGGALLWLVATWAHAPLGAPPVGLWR